MSRLGRGHLQTLHVNLKHHQSLNPKTKYDNEKDLRNKRMWCRARPPTTPQHLEEPDPQVSKPPLRQMANNLIGRHTTWDVRYVCFSHETSEP